MVVNQKKQLPLHQVMTAFELTLNHLAVSWLPDLSEMEVTATSEDAVALSLALRGTFRMG